jgi:chemotaxis regulatin CheY-phosphate phosphatase CheZ
MTTPSLLSEIDTTVQELRLAKRHGELTHKLAQVVSAIGAIPDLPPQDFTADAMARLRELADETVEAVERRIDSGGDSGSVQQQLAGTVYEIRRRMEVVDTWFRHFAGPLG